MASSATEQPRIGGAIPRSSWQVPIVVLVILGLTGWSVVVGTRFDLIELFTSTGPVKRFSGESDEQSSSSRRVAG